MSPRYIPPEQRELIRRLLAEKWDTGEATLDEIAQQLGVSLGTVGRENYVRCNGAAGMDEAIARRKAAMAKLEPKPYTGAKRGPKPGSPRHPNSISPGRPRLELPEERIHALSDAGKSLREIATTISEEMGRKVWPESIRKVLLKKLPS